jgi:hypothetical protein
VEKEREIEEKGGSGTKENEQVMCMKQSGAKIAKERKV